MLKSILRPVILIISITLITLGIKESSAIFLFYGSIFVVIYNELINGKNNVNKEHKK